MLEGKSLEYTTNNGYEWLDEEVDKFVSVAKAVFEEAYQSAIVSVQSEKIFSAGKNFSVKNKIINAFRSAFKLQKLFTAFEDFIFRLYKKVFADERVKMDYSAEKWIKALENDYFYVWNRLLNSCLNDLSAHLDDGVDVYSSLKAIDNSRNGVFNSIETIAVTEGVRAVVEAKLRSYAVKGIKNVVYRSETGSNCTYKPPCNTFEGKRYAINDAHGVIPRHPHCRCYFVEDP